MSNLIVIFADPTTREVKIDFPEPEGGAPKLNQPKEPGGKGWWSNIETKEQKAYHHFWGNGTRERINDLIKEGRGAGLRQTLSWLVTLRIGDTLSQIGFRYEYKVITNPAKWQAFLLEKESKA